MEAILTGDAIPSNELASKVTGEDKMLTVEPEWLVSSMPVRVSDRDRIWLLELLLVSCASDRRLAVADPLVFVVPVKNKGTL